MIPIQFVPYRLELKSGQFWKSELTWHYSNQAAEIDQKDIEEVGFRVTGKDGTTYKIEVSRKLLRTELPGVNVNAPGSTKEQKVTERVSQGHLFALPAWVLDTNTKRLSKLYDFGELPAVETWQVHTEEKGVPPTETLVEEVQAREPELRLWRWNPWQRQDDRSGLPLDAEKGWLPDGDAHRRTKCSAPRWN